LANGVEDHASVSGRRQAARIESCENRKLIVGRTPMSLGLSNFDLPFGVRYRLN
jgi:hypothetical protein